MQGKKIRVLLTKSILEDHDRGIRVVARALLEAGMEVILTRFETPQEVVNTALEEDVDVIGISSLSGGHTYAMSEITRLLRQRNRDDILVLLGGIVAEDEIPELEKIGVSKVFGPGMPTQDIVSFMTSTREEKEAKQSKERETK